MLAKHHRQSMSPKAVVRVYIYSQKTARRRMANVLCIKMRIPEDLLMPQHDMLRCCTQLNQR